MYQGQHRELLTRRNEWFERIQEAMTALWWVPAGHRPTVAEAEERLLHLREHGATAYAFTLRTSFPAGEAAPVAVSGEAPALPTWSALSSPDVGALSSPDLECPV
jgi:hypothetical protein